MNQEQYNVLAELAGGFIHDIKNHLGTLSLNLQLLAEDFQDPQNQRERRAFTRVQKMQGECDRLVDFANAFLRFARIEQLKLVPTDLGKLFEELVDFLNPTARAANIDIKSYFPADLPQAQVDPDTFKQALLNLLINALQAMSKGGSITMQAVRDGNWIVLNLIDTGPGMPKEQTAKIFQPFFTTKPGGSGLGLPTTKKIVESHGGRIEVQSEPGQGTQFTIKLPILGTNK